MYICCGVLVCQNPVTSETGERVGHQREADSQTHITLTIFQFFKDNKLFQIHTTYAIASSNIPGSKNGKTDKHYLFEIEMQ